MWQPDLWVWWQAHNMDEVSCRKQTAAQISTKNHCTISTSLKPWSGSSAIRCRCTETHSANSSPAALCPVSKCIFLRGQDTEVRYAMQVAAHSIEIVRREEVIGHEISLMSHVELMELLDMTKVLPTTMYTKRAALCTFRISVCCCTLQCFTLFTCDAGA